MKKEKYLNGQPCSNKTCANHIKTPCDYCGRIGMVGDIELARVVFFNDYVFNNNKIK